MWKWDCIWWGQAHVWNSLAGMCASWGFRCLHRELLEMDGNGKTFPEGRGCFSFLAFCLPRENRKSLLCGIKVCWSLSWWTVQGGKVALAGEGVSMFLQRPLAQALSHPKGGKWMNEGSTQTLTAAPISVLGASLALTPSPGHVLAPRLQAWMEEKEVTASLCVWQPKPGWVWGPPALRMPHRMGTGIVHVAGQPPSLEYHKTPQIL